MPIARILISMADAFRTSRLVQFCETDAAGIAHFSCFFVYMEQAEHEFLRSIGESVVSADEEGKISWPRVASECRFLKPVRFEDSVDIELRIQRLGERSITYAASFSHQGRPVAEGSITSVRCRVAADRAPESMLIPAELREKLSPFVEPCDE